MFVILTKVFMIVFALVYQSDLKKIFIKKPPYIGGFFIGCLVFINYSGYDIYIPTILKKLARVIFLP